MNLIEMIDFDVAVVVPMAGCSERFPSSCQKQYYNILVSNIFQKGNFLFIFFWNSYIKFYL